MVVDTAARARRRMLAADLPRVLGHADFEAHNLRWHDRQVRTVHDWDSLAWQPEAALVGAASAVFPKTGPATLPPIESTEAFLAAYQHERGRAFTTEEQQIAWAAGLWPAAHDIRWESLHGYTALSGKALWIQAAERLRRANA
ncbi:phosphotransferase [Nocardia sp. IFM 10818]